MVRNGSQKKSEWGEGHKKIRESETNIDSDLMFELALFRSTFFITSDASDQASGAELCHDLPGLRKPVTLFPLKLTESKLNWEVKEMQIYAIVARLHQ